MKRLATLLTLILTCFTSVFAITGQEVVDTYFKKNPAPDSSKTTFKVESFKNGKLDDSLTLIQFGRHTRGVTETVFEVTVGAQLKGTRFKQAQRPQKDERWIYMPALKTVRRIGESDKSKSFVGTEYTYNDTALREANDDKHTLTGEETISINGTSYNCYVVKSDPVKRDKLEFYYRVQFFDKNSYMPVRIEYYDRNNKLIKKIDILKLSVITGATGLKHYTREVSESINLRTNRKTILTILDQKLDIDMPAGYFQQSWLSTGKM